MNTTTTTKKKSALTDDLGQEFELQFKDVTYAENASSGQIMLPAGMALPEAIYWLKLKQQELETIVTINERIEGYPIDVAYALQSAVKEMFGVRELRNGGFFGERPPQFMTVPSNERGDMVEVFIGKFSLPGIEGTIETGRDWNDALIVVAQIKQKSLPQLRKLLTLTREKLAAESLYKGKAFRVWMTKESNGFEEKLTLANPEFIDTAMMPAELVLNRDTKEVLEASLWTPIERTAQCRHYGISLKRGILLEGPFGTGKSLTALETARRAQANGWTFIYLKDVRDLKRVYTFAVRYAPAVIFAEDIDLITETDDDAGVNMLNNVLDGMDTKHNEVILVLTTNYRDKLPQSLLRPGRFDAMISYRLPNTEAAAALVQQYAGGDIDPAGFNVQEVGAALQGKQPATIHEIVKRAKLFSQRRHEAEYRGPLLLSTADIVASNASMEEHLQLLNRAVDKIPSAMEQFGTVVGHYINAGVVKAAAGGLSGAPRDRVDYFEGRASEPADRNLVGQSNGR